MKSPVVEKNIRNSIHVLKTLHKISSKGLSRPPCFDGMLITLKSILNIYEEQKQIGFEFLLTNRLNQDPIENTFASYSQRGGHNENPTVRTFRSTIS